MDIKTDTDDKHTCAGCLRNSSDSKSIKPSVSVDELVHCWLCRESLCKSCAGWDRLAKHRKCSHCRLCICALHDKDQTLESNVYHVCDPSTLKIKRQSLCRFCQRDCAIQTYNGCHHVTVSAAELEPLKTSSFKTLIQLANVLKEQTTSEQATTCIAVGLALLQIAQIHPSTSKNQSKPADAVVSATCTLCYKSYCPSCSGTTCRRWGCTSCKTVITICNGCYPTVVHWPNAPVKPDGSQMVSSLDCCKKVYCRQNVNCEQEWQLSRWTCRDCQTGFCRHCTPPSVTANNCPHVSKVPATLRPVPCNGTPASILASHNNDSPVCQGCHCASHQPCGYCKQLSMTDCGRTCRQCLGIFCNKCVFYWYEGEYCHPCAVQSNKVRQCDHCPQYLPITQNWVDSSCARTCQVCGAGHHLSSEPVEFTCTVVGCASKRKEEYRCCQHSDFKRPQCSTICTNTRWLCASHQRSCTSCNAIVCCVECAPAALQSQLFDPNHERRRQVQCTACRAKSSAALNNVLASIDALTAIVSDYLYLNLSNNV